MQSYLSSPAPTKRMKARQRRKAIAARAVQCIAVLAVAFVIVYYGFDMVMDAAERESQWRADRLCQQGYYCDPKRGP